MYRDTHAYMQCIQHLHTIHTRAHLQKTSETQQNQAQTTEAPPPVELGGGASRPYLWFGLDIVRVSFVFCVRARVCVCVCVLCVCIVRICMYALPKGRVSSPIWRRSAFARVLCPPARPLRSDPTLAVYTAERALVIRSFLVTMHTELRAAASCERIGLPIRGSLGCTYPFGNY